MVSCAFKAAVSFALTFDEGAVELTARFLSGGSIGRESSLAYLVGKVMVEGRTRMIAG